MSEWKTSQLCDIADIEIGGTPSRHVPKYWAGDAESGYPWVSISDLKTRIIVDTKERITNSAVANSNVKKIVPGSLLVSFKLSIGRAAIAGVELFTNEAIAAVLPKGTSVHPAYLYYVLPPVCRNAITETAVKGATLNKESLGKLCLTLPKSYSEQRKIARILQTIDRAIEKTEALIDKYQQIKAGLMHDLFTRGIGPNGQLRPPREQAPELYQETPIGWLPREWGVSSIGSMSVRVTNGFVGTATPFYSQANDSVLYLFGNNVRPDRLDIDNAKRVTARFHMAQAKSQLQPGDMLTVQSGHIGVSAVVPEVLGAANCHALIITRFQQGEVVPDFVSAYLNSPIGMKRQSTIFIGSTILHINTSDLFKFSVPVPTSIDEQTEIVRVLQSNQAMVDSELHKLSKLRSQKAGLMQDLLTGKVTVQVEAESETEAAHV